MDEGMQTRDHCETYRKKKENIFIDEYYEQDVGTPKAMVCKFILYANI